MKIGILTFHSQLNYGGLLQAYALQKFLSGMGHEVQIIDRWPNTKNTSLELGYNRLGFMGWANVVVRSLLGGLEWKKYQRVMATKRFLREYLHLTPYHFVNWSDLSTSTSDLNLDCIIVGSDQVWHAGDDSDPAPYLLEGCPFSRAISYAASFGMSVIPPDHEMVYREGLQRFKMISCRESEGVSICEKLGFDATHVVDPTLLLDSVEWQMLVGAASKHARKRVVCYFMDGNVPRHIKELESFARVNNVDVDVFLDSRFYAPLPKSLSQLRERFRCLRINERVAAGPIEFVQAIAHADFVLTDSFHALMFSCIFNKNMRFIRPENHFRRQMFSRIEEFASGCIDGELFVDTAEQGVTSFGKGEQINYRNDVIGDRRNLSKQWLRKAIKA